MLSLVHPFDYEEMAEGMLWVNLSGTAVTLDDA